VRTISYSEFRAAAQLDNQRLKVLRQLDQCAGAFGRSEFYSSLGYLDLDLIAVRLTDALTENIVRNRAADIVRDQWGIWLRVVAIAETSGLPAFFYVIEYETAKGTRWHMTTGSMLDSRSDINLRKIAEEIRSRAGVIAKSYVAVEMQSLLDDVRKQAKQNKVVLSERFLPPYGSSELDAVLKPFGDDAPDRAIIVTNEKMKADASDKARRSGILARAFVEANILQ
jgi:hypothetical protein